MNLRNYNIDLSNNLDSELGFVNEEDQFAYRREDLFGKIIDRVTKHITPLLKEIDEIVAYGDSQTKATNEHNEQMKKDLFRKGVVVEMKLLANRLPNGHPIKTRIESL